MLCVWCPGPLGSYSPMGPLGALCCLCGVLGHLASVRRCVGSASCVACTVSWATWLLFTGVPARRVLFGVRCPGPLGSCSPVCLLDVMCCACGVLGQLAPVHRCARSVCCLRVRCPGPLGSCSPVCLLGVLFCLCGALGHSAPVHRCARSMHFFSCVVSSVTSLLFAGVPAWFVLLRVRCPGPLGSCSPVCLLCVLFCLCVSWATWLLFTGVAAWCVVLLLRCPGPLGSCSALCPLGVLCCLCGVLDHFGPFSLCARSACCVACAVSWATWLLFTSVRARRVVLLVRCLGPLGSCSPVRPLGALFGFCGVLDHLAPVHRFARSACCVVYAVSWATWLLVSAVPAWWVVLLVRCPGPLGSCSPVCSLSILCCVCGVLGHLAPVHRCARSACFVACAVSLATLLLFTGVPARCDVLHVQSPGPLGSCSPVFPLGALLCVCGVLGHFAPVHLFTARCVVLRVRCPGRLGSCSPPCPLGVLPVFAVSWATWLLFTGVPARCVVLFSRCSGPLGSGSPVCPLGAFLCVCGVLGHIAPVHQCARLVCCVACALSSAT